MCLESIFRRDVLRARRPSPASFSPNPVPGPICASNSAIGCMAYVQACPGPRYPAIVSPDYHPAPRAGCWKGKIVLAECCSPCRHTPVCAAAVAALLMRASFRTQ